MLELVIALQVPILLAREHMVSLSSVHVVPLLGLTVFSGAPEVYRDHRRLASLHLDTKRDIDIWSMGCVLSEVAVWLVHGYQYLDEYRRRRSAEFHKQSGKNPADCFHDGRGNVLNFVKKTHEDLPDNFRKWDHCTGEVLDRLVSQMIKAGPRPPALIIYEYSREIIEGVKKQMNGGSTKIGNRPFSNMGQHRPKLPPNLPPGHERKIKHQPTSHRSTKKQSYNLTTHSIERIISHYLTHAFLRTADPLSGQQGGMGMRTLCKLNLLGTLPLSLLLEKAQG